MASNIANIGIFIMTVMPTIWLRIVGYIIYTVSSGINLINAAMNVTLEDKQKIKNENAGMFYATISSIVCIAFEIMIIAVSSLLGRAIVLVIYRIVNYVLYKQSVKIAMT